MNYKDVINVKDLYFRYSTSEEMVIRNANFSIKEGMIYGLVGRNSTGKTTLLNLLSGKLDRYAGNILCGGREVVETEGEIGFISEDTKFFNDFSVMENGKIVGALYENFNLDKFLEKIKEYGIDKWSFLFRLSEGERMLFKLAFILAYSPKVLILDEPSGVFDINGREQLIKELRSISADENITVIMATHLTSDLDGIIDYCLYINDEGDVECTDLEEMRDKYMILHGNKELFEDFSDSMFVAKEIRGNIISAMTNNYIEIKELVKEKNISASIPDIEEIMYYFTLEENSKLKTDDKVSYKEDIVMKKHSAGNKGNVFKVVKMDIQKVMLRKKKLFNMLIGFFVVIVGIAFSYYRGDTDLFPWVVILIGNLLICGNEDGYVNFGNQNDNKSSATFTAYGTKVRLKAYYAEQFLYLLIMVIAIIIAALISPVFLEGGYEGINDFIKLFAIWEIFELIYGTKEITDFKVFGKSGIISRKISEKTRKSIKRFLLVISLVVIIAMGSYGYVKYKHTFRVQNLNFDSGDVGLVHIHARNYDGWYEDEADIQAIIEDLDGIRVKRQKKQLEFAPFFYGYPMSKNRVMISISYKGSGNDKYRIYLQIFNRTVKQITVNGVNYVILDEADQKRLEKYNDEYEDGAE